MRWRSWAAERFLATRSFGWRAEPVDDPKQPVLLPLIDLLNHHHRGAPFRIEAGAMRMATAQPESSGECFAHYGHRRDGLDLALHFGHADSSTPLAHDAPLQISVEGVGVRLIHLCCHRGHPEWVRTILKLALQASLQRRGHGQMEAQRLAQRGLEALAAANITLLHQLIAVITGNRAASTAAQPTHTPTLARAVAAHRPTVSPMQCTSLER